ncbi:MULTISPECIES: hypothetical protein [Pectobacterium]|nr:MULTISPECIES: hypothetical protein [Pectobacterium]UUE36443.1 hypothetical protein L0Y26_00275 [Pectobacterium aroidearum]UUE40818.1 hypothetical protein L0Y25_00275 [Pectobacterium aroidearum]UXK00474.1 hypothetical protein N5056_00285 [Pectobacterium aroidearum]GKV95664.1 hypothetical protein PEC301645_31110 [Pectobacterium carotovorum subsp. carotovorum]
MQADYLDKLESYYRESEKMDLLWHNHDDFFQLLLFSLDMDFSLSKKTSQHEHAKYFISYTSVFLVKNVLDLELIEKKTGSKIGIFMNLFFNNNLVSNELIKKIIYKSDFIGRIDGYSEWIEYPLMLAARSVISFSEEKDIELNDLIPSSFSISNYIKEYLLSWAYEEGKLSTDAEIYFKINFNKKYKIISSILENK